MSETSSRFRYVRIGLCILLTLLCASGLCWWGWQTLHRMPTEHEGEDACVQVCVLNRSLLRGEVITSNDVRVVTWLSELTPAEACVDAQAVVGQSVNHAMPARSLLTTYDIDPCDHQLIIPSGCDAISVEASQIKAVAGAITPGSVVDVYCHREGQTYLLLEQVLVLDIAPDATWLTLALAPDRVQEVIAASNAKALYFSKPSTSSEQNHRSDETP